MQTLHSNTDFVERQTHVCKTEIASAVLPRPLRLQVQLSVCWMCTPCHVVRIVLYLTDSKRKGNKWGHITLQRFIYPMCKHLFQIFMVAHGVKNLCRIEGYLIYSVWCRYIHTRIFNWLAYSDRPCECTVQYVPFFLGDFLSLVRCEHILALGITYIASHISASAGLSTRSHSDSVPAWSVIGQGFIERNGMQHFKTMSSESRERKKKPPLKLRTQYSDRTDDSVRCFFSYSNY